MLAPQEVEPLVGVGSASSETAVRALGPERSQEVLRVGIPALSMANVRERQPSAGGAEEEAATAETCAGLLEQARCRHEPSALGEDGGALDAGVAPDQEIVA